MIWVAMMSGLFVLFEMPYAALSSPVIWMYIIMFVTGILYLVGPCRTVKRHMCSEGCR